MQEKIIKVMSKGQIQETVIPDDFVIINFFDKNQLSLKKIQKIAIAKNESIEKNNNILEIEANDIELINDKKINSSFEVKIFNEMDAYKIIDFIIENKDKNFIFQCDYGKSRSLTTAIFAHKFLLRQHKLINNEYKIRNKMIYRYLFKNFIKRK